MDGIEARVRAVLAHPVFHPLALSLWLIPPFVFGTALLWPGISSVELLDYSEFCGASLRGLGGFGLVTAGGSGLIWLWLCCRVLLQGAAKAASFRELRGKLNWGEVVAACRSVRFRDVLAVNLSCWVSLYVAAGPGAFCAV